MPGTSMPSAASTRSPRVRSSAATRTVFTILSGAWFVAAACVSAAEAPSGSRTRALTPSTIALDSRQFPDAKTYARSDVDRDVLVSVAERVLSAMSARLGDGVRATLRLHAVHMTAQGPYIAQYRQFVDAIEVAGARANVVFDRGLSPLAITGAWAPPIVAVQHGKRGGTDAQQAVRIALDAFDLDGVVAKAGPPGVDSGAWQRFDAPGVAETIRVKPVWMPGIDGLRAAHQLELVASQWHDGVPRAEALFISADDGTVLRRANLVHRQQSAEYRVFADEDGHPYVDPYGFTNPHPAGVPDGSRPTQPAPMRLLQRVHGGLATGDPWLPTGETTTVGNNVDAFFNAMPINNGRYSWWFNNDDLRFFSSGHGDHRAPMNRPGAFDHAYDVDQAPADYFQLHLAVPTAPLPVLSPQLNAKIVQAFYAANWLHDLFHDLGFDEASGNAQHDNFGRGGLGGDRLVVHAAASSTFAMVTDDGEAPMLALGVNDRSLANADVSAFAFDVLAHEWTHVMFVRLNGYSFETQAGAINEGTADFIGTLLTMREQDGPEFDGAYAIGGYYNHRYDDRTDTRPPAGAGGVADDSWFHGIRRFPLSADTAINPLGFRHIGLDHPLPPEWNANDWKWRSRVNAEIHTAGEVWASAMWQCAHEVLTADGPDDFGARRRRILGNLVAALKLMPPDPTYIEARNAVLLAFRADDAARHAQCRAGFAKRGMGAGAIAPPRTSDDLRGVVESHADRDHALAVVASALVPLDGDDDVLDHGERGELRVTVVNSGLRALEDIRVDAVAADGAVQLARGRLADALVLGPDETATVSAGVTLLSRQGLRTAAFDIDLQSAAGDGAQAHARAAFATNYRVVTDAFVDEAAGDEPFAASWSTGFGGNPHGCAPVCVYGDIVNWSRRTHAGEPAYVVGDPHIGFDAHLVGPAFRVGTTAPLVLHLRHAYRMERSNAANPNQLATASVELRIDGGDWQRATDLLQSGRSHHTGRADAWSDERLDFGTALAGRELQFRLRARAWPSFDASPAFWAVSRIAIDGAAEPMFARIDAVTLPPVEAGHSGSWFVPERSGEGWVIEVLDAGVAVMSWFTYPAAGDDDARQAWMQGIGRVDGNRIVFDDVDITGGAAFGSGFDPADVVRQRWGRVEFEFNSCHEAVVHFDGPEAFGRGTRQAVRLTAIDGLGCGETAPPAAPLRSGFSGAWFDPGHDGEGWFLQSLGADTAALFWFTYTSGGAQAWMSGVGRWQGDRLVVDELSIPRGTHFGAGFDASAIDFARWGRVELRFDDCEHAVLEYASDDPSFGTGRLEPVRLTRLAGLGCQPP